MIYARALAFLVFCSATIVYASASDQTCSAGDETCTSPECQDDHDHCSFWASEGECDSNPAYMLQNCKVSCGQCTEKPSVATTPKPSSKPSSTCVDDNEECEKWADGLECEINPAYMLQNCKLSCNVCHDPEMVFDLGVAQKTKSPAFLDFSEEEVTSHILKSENYLRTSKLRLSLKRSCHNQHELCTLWALSGRCHTNPQYMETKCAPACQTCHMLTVEGRCPLDPDAPETWEKGSLNKMFEKLTQEPYLSEYSVEILSSPATNGPWVITMENVVTAEEAERLIELGSEEGYERSTDVGKMKADGTTERSVSTGRTSSNAWCQNECYQDPKAQSVVHRLSNITGIPEENSEYIQLLKYLPGQFYKSHHDYIPFHINRQQGVRILTMYLYLNDVTSGGGTNFDKLDITVMPKRGRALLWPSVLDEDPSKKDERTTHQALPVGDDAIKFGANAWFHLRDFKTALARHCT